MMANSCEQRDIIWEIDPDLFCTDDQFPVPQVADFPCMSSSSSSSNLVPIKPISSTVSTASSMSSSAAVNIGGVPDGSGAIDAMENYGYMDLIDGNDVWDPSSLFEQDPPELTPESEVVEDSVIRDDGGGRLDELGTMFFDWLKSNKEFISAEDMRKIKLKKSTVESASKRLGSSKEGKKQLLKLILEWVQQHQLQRKNSDNSDGGVNLRPAVTDADVTRYPPPFSSGSWVAPGDIGSGFSHQMWMPPYPPHYADQACNGMGMMATTPFSYMGYDSGLNSQLNLYDNHTGSCDYQVLKSVPPSWNPSQVTMTAPQFPDMGNAYAPQIMPLASSFRDPFPYNPAMYAPGGGEERRLMRLGSLATKEARKKRMARQRRTYFHHSRQNHNNHHNVANSDQHPQAMLVDDNCVAKPHEGNWLYWPSPPSTTMVPLPPMEATHKQSSMLHPSGEHQSIHASSDELQELKSEKNLKFLLQKVLKQSDVGSLGRIVMPKKEAECHLPDLESRDGITIAMEDIGTSQVWNMRYRFWPNNKSRMYLLENTGNFVKANGLQEGDFIVLYSNVKCGKYLIRGVKVRQPASGKSEGKKAVKKSRRSTS